LLNGFSEIFCRRPSPAFHCESLGSNILDESNVNQCVDRSIMLKNRVSDDERRQQWLTYA